MDDIFKRDVSNGSLHGKNKDSEENMYCCEDEKHKEALDNITGMIEDGRLGNGCVGPCFFVMDTFPYCRIVLNIR